ncbi:MAG TPA: imidazole glycerol phosphate synthase subunit HisF [Solirubrobacteraceae bacterium]|jgi:cyclase
MSRKAEIAILDYGLGNLRSVAKAFEHVGATVRVTADEKTIRGADGLVIVGVGAFPEAMRRLSGLGRIVVERHAEETPILGICLGLQLFFEGADEHGGARGFGFLDGEVRQIATGGARLPHIGWNRVRWERSSELLDGLPDECAFYHVHSYAAQPADENVVLGTTEYGSRFVSAIQQGSLFGVQFHPEKSSTHGLKLLSNFANVCVGAARSVRPPVARSSRPGLCKRIVPCLDVDAGRVVKGTNFVDLRDAGDPVELAEFYDAEGADEITFLDITATHEKRDTIAKLAKEAVDRVFVPITIGGGIRAVADAQTVLDAGADNISVNSAAVARPELLNELDEVFANQNLILAIDAKRSSHGAGWEAYVAGGRTPTGRDAIAWAQEGVERGAGQILITSMDRDGTRDGYDIDLLTKLSEAVQVPIIASGGAGTLDHLTEALEAGADAVLCASIFHYGHHSVRDVKRHVDDHGIMVRLLDAPSSPTGDGDAAPIAFAAP